MPSYPGDFDGPLDPTYSPRPDGEPDAGEVVWAHVPYEEDATQGKDRPVLIVGFDGEWVLGMHLTSKDHDRDEEQELRADRIWVDVGPGGWDSKGRPSEVRVNRIVRIERSTIRREGAVLERSRWDEVMAAWAPISAARSAQARGPRAPRPEGEAAPRTSRTATDVAVTAGKRIFQRMFKNR